MSGAPFVASPYEPCLQVARTCTYFHVRRATRALAERFDAALRPVGLKGTQFTLLVAIRLAEAPRLGRLAEVLGMDRTTLSRNLRPLERDGLVASGPGDDRRARMLRLTPAGEERLRAAYPLWEREQARIVAALGHDTWRGLMAGANAVHARVADEREPDRD